MLYESGLFKTWQQSIVPDAPSVGLLKKMGLRVRYVPSVTMVNYEKCDLPFAYDFMKRQMTWTRTYHAHWIPVCLNAGVLAVLPVFGVVLGVMGTIARRMDAPAWCFIGFAGYSMGTLLLVGMLEHSARKAVRAQGNRILHLPLAAALRIPFALLITQVVQLAAIIAATFRKTITWRGVTYYIRRPFDVEITKDYPIEQSEEAIKANVSQ